MIELNENAQVIVKYIEKYVEKNQFCYQKLLQLTLHPELTPEISDEQWTLIIDQAWQFAYRKALEDSYLSPEERVELNKIKNLAVIYQNVPGNRVALNYCILNSFKHIVEVDKKEENEMRWELRYPKPTPYDNQD